MAVEITVFQRYRKAPAYLSSSPEMITAIKNDMIRVISRYMKIEKDAVRLTMDAGSFSDGQIHHLPVLRADIPIRSMSSKGLY